MERCSTIRYAARVPQCDADRCRRSHDGQLYNGSDGVVTSAPLMRHPWLVVPGFTQMFRRDLTRFSSLHSASRDVTGPVSVWHMIAGSIFSLRFWDGLPSSVSRWCAIASRRQRLRGVYRPASASRAAWPGRGIRPLGRRCGHEPRRAIEADAGLLTPQQRERSAQGIVYYRRASSIGWRIAWRCMHRHPISRDAGIFVLVRRGGYGKTLGSARFGWSEFVMDAWLAVPFGPRLRRMLPWCIAAVEKAAASHGGRPMKGRQNDWRIPRWVNPPARNSRE